jgi:hypothetical protein
MWRNVRIRLRRIVTSSWPPHDAPRLALGYTNDRRPRRVVFGADQLDAMSALRSCDRAVVEGASGTGKTHIAVALACEYARREVNVRYLTTRGPLVAWLRPALEPLGITVETVQSCAARILTSAGHSVRSGTDRNLCADAAELFRPAAREVVIADEWQDAAPEHQALALRLAEHGIFVAFVDSGRRLQPLPAAGIQTGRQFYLSEGFRTPPRLADLAAEYQRNAGACRPPGPLLTVRAFVAKDPSELRERLREALAFVARLGIQPDATGIVSLLPQRESAVFGDCRSWQGLGVPLDAGEAGRQLAVDNVWRWSGLERRAIILVEAALHVELRSQRMRAAITRAVDCLQLVILEQHLEHDPILSAWFRPDGPPKGHVPTWKDASS